MDELRKLQLVSVKMLKEFDEICSRNNIEYFAVFGTLLGAVRHRGFIPWDDDIDIGMLRTEYRKLKELPQEEWGESLYLADGDSGENYHEKLFPRVYMKGTDFESTHWVKYIRNDKKGIGVKPISIDILLYDHVRSPEEAQQKLNRARRLNRDFLYTKYCMNIAPGDPPLAKAKTLFKRLAHRWLSLFHTPEEILHRYYRLVSQTEGEYLISFDSWTVNDIMGSLMKEEDMFPLQELPFDGITIKALRCTDVYLKQVYGDYMQLPPENQRFGHVPQILVLGEENFEET